MDRRKTAVCPGAGSQKPYAIFCTSTEAPSEYWLIKCNKYICVHNSRFGRALNGQNCIFSDVHTAHTNTNIPF